MIGSKNLFLYSENNPINYTDPYGLLELEPFIRDYTYGATDEIISQFDAIRKMNPAGSTFPDWLTSWQTELLSKGLNQGNDFLFNSLNMCSIPSKDSVGYYTGKGVVFALSILMASEAETASRSPGLINKALGKPFPTKFNRAFRLQPYDPATRKYLSYTANSGFRLSPLTRFSSGFGQGYANAKGVGGGTPIGRAGNLGYILGNIIGNLF